MPKWSVVYQPSRSDPFAEVFQQQNLDFPTYTPQTSCLSTAIQFSDLRSGIFLDFNYYP